MYRLASQLLSKNQVAIIGGYHGVNLGDMALGYSVLELLKIRGIKACLQTIYTLDKYPWPLTKYAIVGGGAVGYNSSLVKVVNRYKGNYNKVSMLGVDYNEPSYDEDIKTLIKNASWLSCRNENQALFLESLINSKNVLYHPDLAFSYKRKFCEARRASEKKRVLLINVVPLYGDIFEGELRPSDNYKNERPELFNNYKEMINNYYNGVREIAKKAIDDGYVVESIPFTPGDEAMGKIILKGLKVTHNKYSDSPEKMLTKMGNAEKVFATRYHATIFAFKVGANVIPMAYAKKNEYLLNELGFNRDQYISSTDLANGKKLINTPVKVDEQIISKWELNCYNVINNSIDSLLKNN